MEMIKSEWKKIFSNKILLISFIVMCFIPILYASFFLKSVWDPYGMTENLPIAVVNEDKEVAFEGKTLSIGRDVVKELQEDSTLEWHFVSKAEAKEGLKNKDFYMILTLPDNFSANAATVLSDNPQKMSIEYETNGALNYFGEVIGDQAAKELKSKVSEKVTKAYVDSIVGQLSKVADGFTTAADGSTKLKDGIDKVKDGNETIFENLNKLKDASLTFSDGTDSISLGLSRYIGGVEQARDGAKDLQTGLGTLAKGITAYTQGVSSAYAGIAQLNGNSKALNDGMKQVADGVAMIPEQLGSKLAGLSENSEKITQLATGMSAVDTAINQLKDGADKTAAAIPDEESIDALTKYLSPEVFKNLPAEQQAVILEKVTASLNGYKTLKQAVQGVAGGLESLSKQTPVLVKGTQTLSDQITTLAGSTPALMEKLTTLNEGAKELEKGLKTYTAGVGKLDSGLGMLNTKAEDLNLGAKKAEKGSMALYDGLTQITANDAALTEGVTKLADGANKIYDGTSQLADGSEKLDTGLTELAAGAGDLEAGLSEGKEKVSAVEISEASVDMIASPDTLNKTKYSEVPNYGHALAPYVMSLALYVGCMIFNFIYPIRKVAKSGKSAFQWWVSKLSVGFVAATAMALLETIIMKVLGITTSNFGEYIVMALITAYAYMFFIMLLAMAFDNPGRFVAMVLLVLQLAGAGGTFPMQLTSEFFNKIHALLPMSYSIMGFRQAISGGLGGATFTHNMAVLACLAIISIALLLVAMELLQKHNKAGVSQLDNNQKLFDTDYDYAESNM
ncbi:YhgE/Pip domain-containing protein [Anaerocolumna cellulosilytica]|nr:YhgE/Pip domain-containing protein [Anaerocolumna cellulosilytica]MBB5195027.1 putative membrane protein [Anaerocolumna cellulosilytica]